MTDYAGTQYIKDTLMTTSAGGRELKCRLAVNTRFVDLTKEPLTWLQEARALLSDPYPIQLIDAELKRRDEEISNMGQG